MKAPYFALGITFVLAIGSVSLASSADQSGLQQVGTTTQLLEGLKYIKTPLSLSGFVFVILYLLLGLIIKHAPATAWRNQLRGSLLEKIVSCLFILALTAMFFGFAGWMAELWAKMRAPERLLSGVVIDENNLPVSGAEISVDGLEDRRKTTQSTGNFELRVPSRSRYTLRVRADGAYTASDVSAEDADKPLRIVLKRVPPTSDVSPRASPRLEFVEIIQTPNPETESDFPALEVTVRNKTGALIVLKRAEIQVLAKRLIDVCARYYPIKTLATWYADINLDDLRPLALKVDVPTDDVRRFRIILGHDLDKPGHSAYYQLKMEIVYNEDDRREVSKLFWLSVPPRLTDLLPRVVPGEELTGCYEERERQMKQIEGWVQSYTLSLPRKSP